MAGIFVWGEYLMKLKNYIRVRTRIPFIVSYCYIDCDEYVADEIFSDHEMTFIYFHKKELYNEDTNFVISRCSILKKDEGKFIECMEHLRRKLEFLDYNMEFYDELSEALTKVQE